jgi:hypothetical protein
MMRNKKELIKTFELIPNSKITSKEFHQCESKLNEIFFQNFELGVMLSYFLDQTYNNSFDFNIKSNFKELLILVFKSFLNFKIPKDSGKSIIYFNRGKHRHYLKMTNSFYIDKDIRNKTLIIGSHESSDKRTIFHYFKLIDFFKAIRFLSLNNKLIFKSFSLLNFSKKKRTILSIHLIIQLLKTLSIEKFLKKQNSITLIGSDADRGVHSSIFYVVSRAHSIQSFTLQHGVINGYFGKYPLNADEVLVWGKMARRQFIEMGLDENRIKLTGTPIIEEIITSQKIKISKKKKYLLKSGKTICLALSNPNKEDDIKLVAFFSDIKNKYGEIDDNFLIKLHPARDRSKYKWIEEEFELQIIPSNIPYNDFIIFTDVLLTHSSGIATECLFYNKKVGILDILSRSSGNGMMLNIFYDTLLIKKTSDFEKLVNNQTSLTPEEIYYKTGVSASIEICKYIKNKL